MTQARRTEVAVIGGGPAGLMAASVLAEAGVAVTVFDAKPSFGRKLLRAGVGGLNLTHAEPYVQFCQRYGRQEAWLRPMLDAFAPEDLRQWAASLGVATFVGSSGRVFPVGMKAAPLLRAWLLQLRTAGVTLLPRHRWLGWHPAGGLHVATPAGEQVWQAQATVLALGGGSWPQLGSDAAWVPWLQARGVPVMPLLSANCGFDVAWSAHLRERFAGSPLKSVQLTVSDAAGRAWVRRGDLLVSEYGLEGSLMYALSQPARDAWRAQGSITVWLDLLPARTPDEVLAAVRHPRGARSLSSHLQSRLGLKGIKAALLREGNAAEVAAALHDPVQLARRIKALPLVLGAPRPLAEAISTAGGVAHDAVDAGLMLKALPGVFVAGEMLDWEAPTGGYLLNACLAQGRWVGQAVQDWLNRPPGATAA